MGSFGDKAAPRYTIPGDRTRKTFLYILYAMILTATGAATVSLINPLYLIGIVVGIAAIFTILKYPFFGFIVYLVIYFLRPAERMIGLDPLRLELVFGGLLLAMLIISDSIRGQGLRLPKDRISLIILVFLGVLATSMVFSEWVTESYETLIKTIKIFILYYFVVMLADSERRFTLIFWLMVLFTCFVGIEATYNYYTGNYVFDQGIMRAEGQTSYGNNFNGLAMYMATTLPLLFYLMVRHRKIAVWLICLALGGGCVLTLILTGSRSGVLCLVAVVLTYILFLRRRLIYMLAAVLIGLAVWTVVPDQYKTRYSTMTEGEIDESTQGRINAWKAGMEMLIEKPVFGVGPGVFAAAYLERKGIWLSSHSLYVEMTATLGIIGTIVWASFLYLLIRSLWRLRLEGNDPLRRRFRTKTYSYAMLSVISGLLIAGIFGHILYRDTWYLMAALTISLERLVTRGRDSGAAST